MIDPTGLPSEARATTATDRKNIHLASLDNLNNNHCVLNPYPADIYYTPPQFSSSQHARFQLLYSEKQLRDIKILLTLKHLRIQFSNKLFLSLIELSLCNSPKCKFEIHGSLVTI